MSCKPRARRVCTTTHPEPPYLQVAVAWLKQNHKTLRVLNATRVLKLPPKQRVAMCKAMYYNEFTVLIIIIII